MPATLGIMVTRCRYFQIGPLRVADTQILSVDPTAAKQFRRDPRDLVGRYMSDFQTKAWRQMGHDRYRDRKMGRSVTKDYVVQVVGTDGEPVYQRREFGGFMAGIERGEDIYLTYVEEVREVDHGPTIRAILDPDEQQLARQYNGDCTVNDLRHASDNSALPLALRETFAYIMAECDTLSSGHFAGKHATPLDLALSDDVAVCWYGTRKTPKMGNMVRPRFVCDRCGWVWYGTTNRRADCTACGKHYREERKPRKK